MMESEERPQQAVEERVLLLAPEGRNASVAAATLSQNGFNCAICTDSGELAEALAAGAAVVLLTDDVVRTGPLDAIAQVLQEQPRWSDPPFVLLAWPETGEAALAALAEIGANVRLVERPASVPALVTAVESAHRARSRQYEIRSLLAELHDLNNELEIRVAQRTQKVRELAVTLAQAEEQERERLAQLLHDHLQQILVAVTIQLQLTASSPEVVPGTKSALAEVEEMVDEAIEATRNLSMALSPPVLRQEDVGAALRWLKKEMMRTHHLEVDLALAEDAATATGDLATLIFRTARELLFNVVKHAGVEQARVTLRRQEAQLVLAVADSGQGFVARAAEKNGSGYGLPSIRERVALRGGTVAVEATPGAGTVVTVSLPL